MCDEPHVFVPKIEAGTGLPASQDAHSVCQEDFEPAPAARGCITILVGGNARLTLEYFEYFEYIIKS